MPHNIIVASYKTHLNRSSRVTLTCGSSKKQNKQNRTEKTNSIWVESSSIHFFLCSLVNWMKLACIFISCHFSGAKLWFVDAPTHDTARLIQRETTYYDRIHTEWIDTFVINMTLFVKTSHTRYVRWHMFRVILLSWTFSKILLPTVRSTTKIRFESSLLIYYISKSCERLTITATTTETAAKKTHTHNTKMAKMESYRALITGWC